MPAVMTTKNVLIAGSTGMVGELVLRECLARPEVGRVTTIVRRPTGRARVVLENRDLRAFS